MNKSEIFKYFKGYCDDFEKAYSYIKSHFDNPEVYSKELCQMRGYVSQEQLNLIKEMEIGQCEITDVSGLGNRAYDLGLLSQSANFLLGGRYIIPIRDIRGNLLSLVGYFPDKKKYITTPSHFFSKDVLFFNLDNAYRLSWSEYGGVVFLVEGMFDCLSMRSIGLPCIATMGSTVGRSKCAILKLFKKVIYIPDNDDVGRRALNRHDKAHGWVVPHNATGIRLKGSLTLGDEVHKVKDVDNLVSWYDADSVREVLLQFTSSTDEVVDLVL